MISEAPFTWSLFGLLCSVSSDSSKLRTVDILLRVESNWKRRKPDGKYLVLRTSKSQLHRVINLSIAFSVAPELSIESSVLQATACCKYFIILSLLNFLVSNFSLSAPSGLSILKSYPPVQILVQVIWFLVSVPVLSEQMLLAPPMVSQDDSFLTKFWSISIFWTE